MGKEKCSAAPDFAVTWTFFLESILFLMRLLLPQNAKTSLLRDFGIRLFVLE